jgi:hypothetical protein
MAFGDQTARLLKKVNISMKLDGCGHDRFVGRMLAQPGSRRLRHEPRNRPRVPGDPLREPIARTILETVW